MMTSQTTRSDIQAIGEVRSRGWRAAARANRLAATAAYAEIMPMVVELRDDGLSLEAIARVLNANGRTTRQGAEWSKVQVRRVLQRARY